MENTVQRKETGGTGIHVGDCYVWTEIQYLDSPSDYREYLPQYRRSNPDNDPLVMLDSPRQSLRPAGDLSGLLVFCLLIAGLIVLLLLGLE